MADIALQEAQRRYGGVFAEIESASLTTIQFSTHEFPLVAVFEPFDDTNAAMHFGNPVGECHAASEDAAVFDVSDRAQLELTGRDRATFLHNFCTNDVKALTAGSGCEAFVTNIKGRVLAHIFVFATEQSLWIETVADSATRLREHLESFLIADDVQIADRTADLAELLVCGPSAATRLSNLGLDASGLALLEHRRVVWQGLELHLRQVDWLGYPGILVSVPRQRASDLWKFLVDGDIAPAGAYPFHVLRVAAGFPLYGVDISEDHLAQEVARTERAISFTKGCYLGQEPIARLDALGHVNRELRGFRLGPDALPAPDSIVADFEGREIGRFTSYVLSPVDHRPRGLGYVRRPHTTPGSEVLVKCGQDWTPAHVYWPSESSGE